ncbi:urease subunit alpha [Flavobacterium agricola]|uniref:Urease subunit alpha n=1 Tax=Flavobacterium agricola TaxID=2870839 RepID=A0ABY6M4J1_9FLAO|nr:urease subunit alpha [Flavobacterium agricola]UYW02301.1 urease subunit alpha [Flavobacterium agricola]
MSLKVSKINYSTIFGPTVGDKVRLGDTDLIIEIEKDYASYGDEAKFGGGKTLRDGMLSNSNYLSDQGVLDMVITGAVVIDHWGIVKGDIGIKDGKIVGVGRAGNPDTMDNVTPGMIVGPSTEAHNGAGFIVTAGGLDTHVHYISPTQVETALYSGITTMFGGGTGPADGTNATTVTPGKWSIRRMLQSFEDYPMNFGILAKGNVGTIEPIVEQIEAGAGGIKVHEDWGATPAVIDRSLTVADRFDVQVALHSDTLNEAGFLEDTMSAIDNRVIHTFHTEGAGGGHAPDIIKASMYHNVLPASTNPTRPYTKNTIDEHLDMLMVCHSLSRDIPEDVAFADSRIRPETIAAEDVLQDTGVFSIMSSDSQAMGRVGEVIIRTWQTADKMKKQHGFLPEDEGNNNDNFRVKRYVSKYTINPAVAQGISEYVGSIEPGKIADLVIWSPAFFGVKAEMIIKGGFIAASKMGDANASIPTPQPVILRTMWGGLGKAVQQIAFNFVSQVSLDRGIREEYGLSKKLLAVKNCRNISKADMIHNSETPEILVNPENYQVTVNGKLITTEPIEEVALGQRYFLF